MPSNHALQTSHLKIRLDAVYNNTGGIENNILSLLSRNNEALRPGLAGNTITQLKGLVLNNGETLWDLGLCQDGRCQLDAL